MDISSEVIEIIRNAPKFGTEGVPPTIEIQEGQRVMALGHQAQFGTRVVFVVKPAYELVSDQAISYPHRPNGEVH